MLSRTPIVGLVMVLLLRRSDGRAAAVAAGRVILGP